MKEEGIGTFGWVNQPHLTNRQNGDHNKNDIYPLVENLDLSLIEEGLERA